MVIINALIIILLIVGLLPLINGITLLLNRRGTSMRQDGVYQVEGTKARILGFANFVMGIVFIFPGVAGLLGLISTTQIPIWTYTIVPLVILFIAWWIADRAPGTATKLEISQPNP